jgi:hypothetical protein
MTEQIKITKDAIKMAKNEIKEWTRFLKLAEKRLDTLKSIKTNLTQ